MGTAIIRLGAIEPWESVRRWAGSFCVSAAIHGIAIAMLVSQSITFGAKAPGTGGLEISLGPMSAGGAAALEGQHGGPGASTPVQILETPTLVPQAAVDEPPEPPDPEAIAQPVAKKKPVPVPPKPAARTPAKPQAKAEKPRAESLETKTAAGEADTRGNAEASGAGKDGKSSGSGQSDGTSDRQGGAGGGVAGATPSYYAQLQAWLEKHKEFPRAAQARRQQGVARLFFVIDREGKVLDYRIEKTSGHELLDREVLAMIRRASPLPAMPDDMKEARLEVVVPVQFFLR